MKHRNAIEGTQSELVRAHGLRRARYRGLAKTKLQNYFMGAACNVKRWLRREVWTLQQAARGQGEGGQHPGALNARRGRIALELPLPDWAQALRRGPSLALGGGGKAHPHALHGCYMHGGALNTFEAQVTLLKTPSLLTRIKLEKPRAVFRFGQGRFCFRTDIKSGMRRALECEFTADG